MHSNPRRDRTVEVVGGSLVIGFFVVLFVLFASAVFSQWNAQAVLRESASVDHSEQVLQAATLVAAEFSFAESSARGFLLTGNSDFEGEFRKGKAHVYTAIRSIQDLSGDSPAQRQDASALEALAIKRFQAIELEILHRKSPPNSLNSSNTLQAGSILVKDQILQVLDTMRLREQILIEFKKSQSTQSVRWALVGLWSSSLTGFAALSAFFAVVVRYVDSMKKLRLIESTRAIELEERVRERTSELSSANKDLEAFSYSVSHDLRAPLRAMHGYASILKQDSAARLNGDDMRMLDRIQLNCTKMSELIESLLALFRVAKTDLMIEEVNLSQLAHDVVLELQAEYPGTQYNVKIEPGMAEFGDKHMLRVLMVNLIGNAIKFSSKMDRAIIEIGCQESNGEKVYFFKDNGAGFDPNQSGLLFEPFQRLHSEREFPGNGVGLAMCRKIVSRHRGSIWLESLIGQGATVYVTLDYFNGQREISNARSKAITL